MSGIEFLFSFYSLLLGLAVANVVTGFAESWQARAWTRPGLSTFLLGTLILFRAAQQWLSFSEANGAITISAWNVLNAMGMALPYIFISRAMFAREQDKCTQLDDYYLQNSRALMIALLVPHVVSLTYSIASNAISRTSLTHAAVVYGIPLLVTSALIFAKRQWQHRIGLAILLAMIVLIMF